MSCLCTAEGVEGVYCRPKYNDNDYDDDDDNGGDDYDDDDNCDDGN